MLQHDASWINCDMLKHNLPLLRAANGVMTTVCLQNTVLGMLILDLWGSVPRGSDRISLRRPQRRNRGGSEWTEHLAVVFGRQAAERLQIHGFRKKVHGTVDEHTLCPAGMVGVQHGVGVVGRVAAAQGDV